MDKYELHTFIARRHPNICQIAAVKMVSLFTATPGMAMAVRIRFMRPP